MFKAAQPIWLQNQQDEQNIIVATTAEFRLAKLQTSGRLRLRIAGMTRYRVFLNGKFLGNGPSRGPHGFHRIDNWDLSRKCTAGVNLIAVEVAGYNVNSFYTLDAPSFLAFEVTLNERVIFASGRDPLVMSQRNERAQRVQRYSFQRPFTEIWTLRPGSDDWKTNGIPIADAGVYIGQSGIKFIDAIAPLPMFDKLTPIRYVAAGKLAPQAAVQGAFDDLKAHDVDLVTIGQYLQPTRKHAAIDRFVTPEEFKAYEAIARAKGFLMVSSSPLTRSSHHAGDDFARLRAARLAQTGR